MHFCAKLFGVSGLKRPVQCFGEDPAVLEKWAADILSGYPEERHPQARVEISHLVEVTVSTIRPKPKEVPV